MKLLIILIKLLESFKDKIEEILPEILPESWFQFRDRSKRQQRVYLYLAGLFLIVVICDSFTFQFTNTMRSSLYDLMMKYRVVTPKPDPQIVIIDIDEATLSELAKEYGRWPWPRNVFGVFLEYLEEQHPEAVVFDILFSEEDTYNPESDAEFDQIVSETDNTFFPMLRLSEENDPESTIRLSQIPGVIPMNERAEKDRTVGLILPHFNAMIRSGRLGISNLDPDEDDGVIRQYRFYLEEYGWKIPSLPLTVARELKFLSPGEREAESGLLNWRGESFQYPFIPFSLVYNDFMRLKKERPSNEFTGKIVIIGSTAPSLGDIRPTPMTNMHPGVEILATAIDNLKHRDSLREIHSEVIYLVLTGLFIGWIALLFYQNMKPSEIKFRFTCVETLLVVLTFISVHRPHLGLFHWSYYIDLTGPAFWGFLFFIAAKVYTVSFERSVLRDDLSKQFADENREYMGVVMIARVFHQEEKECADFVRKICMQLKWTGPFSENVPPPHKNIAYITDSQKGILANLDGIIVVSWAYVRDDIAMKRAVVSNIKVTWRILIRLIKKDTGAGLISPVLYEKKMMTRQHEGEGMDPNHWDSLLWEGITKLENKRRFRHGFGERKKKGTGPLGPLHPLAEGDIGCRGDRNDAEGSRSSDRTRPGGESSRHAEQGTGSGNPEKG